LITDKSLPLKTNMFALNTKLSDQKTSEISTPSEKESHLTIQQNILSTSHVSTSQDNNHLNGSDAKKPSEDHSKVMNPIANKGLGGMSLLLKEGSEGIITKCSSQMHLNSEKPNSLFLRNSKNFSYETMYGRGDIGIIKTLRKGGYV